MNLLYFLVSLLCLVSCAAPKPVVGVYRSNFAVNGSFLEQIILKEDSSFEYRSNHVIYKFAKGHYKIDTGKIVLSYNFPLFDTSGASSLLSMTGINIEEDRKSMESFFPRYFFNKNGKLFSGDSNGKLKGKPEQNGLLKSPEKNIT